MTSLSATLTPETSARCATPELSEPSELSGPAVPTTASTRRGPLARRGEPVVGRAARAAHRAAQALHGNGSRVRRAARDAGMATAEYGLAILESGRNIRALHSVGHATDQRNHRFCDFLTTASYRQ